ncbi:MoxR family ATPase [Actinoplanes sp. NEAU-A12]|uniref:MoxR family ATPase n=1 Tax=Actinoplanes sandaracinus TaxID=3045177 RepID=A0ABT6WC31_9ACTN|nr:MoxR family ATPase [Actinoplanes sandaracinus]MDI6097261.1 MoxR family ATPase [Actinoplanes sandaracinus]
MNNPEEVIQRLDAVDYLADDGLAMAIFLALRLGKPLLLEGEPGVGKTAAAKALAQALDTPFLRLQCYEGLTAGEALYEWNYQRQLLHIRLAESHGAALDDSSLFTTEFLQERPILRAVRHDGPTAPVLLIDEIDRADDEFEALLFEFLGEAAVTIPELGTFAATRPPVVVLTSNRSRDLHDALRRRCLYHWIPFPTPDRAASIVRRAVEGASDPLIRDACEFIGRVRGLDLDKAPGLAETIDWVSALAALGVTELVAGDVLRTIGAIAKTPDDRDLIGGALPSASPSAPSSASSSAGVGSPAGGPMAPPTP